MTDTEQDKKQKQSDDDDMTDERPIQLTPEILGLINYANKLKTILIWEWSDAPDYLTDVYDQGGDEDHIAFVPFCYSADKDKSTQSVDSYCIPRFMDKGTSFGCSHTRSYAIPGHGLIVVGLHA